MALTSAFKATGDNPLWVAMRVLILPASLDVRECDHEAAHSASAGRGPVLGWRLPMEQTDIESHEIESSRRITATSFRVTRPHNSPLTTRTVHATMVVDGIKA